MPANEADLREHLSSVGEPAQSGAAHRSREPAGPRGLRVRRLQPIGRSLKRRSDDSTSSHSRGGPWPSARRDLGRIVRPVRVWRLLRPETGRPWRLRRSETPGPGGFSPRPADPGAGRRRPQSELGPDAPPKNKRKPPRKDSDRGPKGPNQRAPGEQALRCGRGLAERGRRCRDRRYPPTAAKEEADDE